MRGYFAENRRGVFWKLSGEKECGVLLEWMLERHLMFGKSTYNPTASGQSSCIGLN